MAGAPTDREGDRGRVLRFDASAYRFAPGKMQKVGLFSTPGFFLDLYCLEPGQAQKPAALAQEFFDLRCG